MWFLFAWPGLQDPHGDELSVELDPRSVLELARDAHVFKPPPSTGPTAAVSAGGGAQLPCHVFNSQGQEEVIFEVLSQSVAAEGVWRWSWNETAWVSIDVRKAFHS